jgi:hypothetical protein
MRAWQDFEASPAGVFEGAGMEVEILRAEVQDMRFALANARYDATPLCDRVARFSCSH